MATTKHPTLISVNYPNADNEGLAMAETEDLYASPSSERVIKHANHHAHEGRPIANYLTKSRSVASTKADFLNLQMSDCTISTDHHDHLNCYSPASVSSPTAAIRLRHKGLFNSPNPDPNPTSIVNPPRSSFSGVSNLNPNLIPRTNYKNYIATHYANQAIVDQSDRIIMISANHNGGSNVVRSNHSSSNSTTTNSSSNSSSKWDDAERWVHNTSPKSRSGDQYIIANSNHNNYANYGPVMKLNPANPPDSSLNQGLNPSLIASNCVKLTKLGSAIEQINSNKTKNQQQQLADCHQNQMSVRGSKTNNRTISSIRKANQAISGELVANYAAGQTDQMPKMHDVYADRVVEKKNHYQSGSNNTNNNNTNNNNNNCNNNNERKVVQSQQQIVMKMISNPEMRDASTDISPPKWAAAAVARRDMGTQITPIASCGGSPAHRHLQQPVAGSLPRSSAMPLSGHEAPPNRLPKSPPRHNTPTPVHDHDHDHLDHVHDHLDHGHVHDHIRDHDHLDHVHDHDHIRDHGHDHIRDHVLDHIHDHGHVLDHGHDHDHDHDHVLDRTPSSNPHRHRHHAPKASHHRHAHDPDQAHHHHPHHHDLGHDLHPEQPSNKNQSHSNQMNRGGSSDPTSNTNTTTYGANFSALLSRVLSINGSSHMKSNCMMSSSNSLPADSAMAAATSPRHHRHHHDELDGHGHGHGLKQSFHSRGNDRPLASVHPMKLLMNGTIKPVQLNLITKMEREEARIDAWEHRQTMKAEAELKKLEMKLDRMKNEGREKIRSKLAAARLRADEMRAAARVQRAAKAIVSNPDHKSSSTTKTCPNPVASAQPPEIDHPRGPPLKDDEDDDHHSMAIHPPAPAPPGVINPTPKSKLLFGTAYLAESLHRVCFPILP